MRGGRCARGQSRVAQRESAGGGADWGREGQSSRELLQRARVFHAHSEAACSRHHHESWGLDYPEALPNILVLVPPSSCNAHTFLLSVWQPKLYVGDLNLGVSGQCGYLLFTLNFGPCNLPVVVSMAQFVSRLLI